MIWCPNTGSICGERVTPLPQTAFLIAAAEKPKSGSPRLEIESQVTAILGKHGIEPIFASTYRRGGNILCKICMLIQQVQIGVLIYESTVKRRTIPNLFYEASLMHYLGKELIMIGHETPRPSDLESVEWIKFENKSQFKRAFQDRLKRILQMKGYYENTANIEIGAGNYLVAIEYLKKAILIEPEEALIRKLSDTNDEIKPIEPLNRDYLNNRHFIDTVGNWQRPSQVNTHRQ
jgi:hypothetical protein